jgi:hypothetical protein
MVEAGESEYSYSLKIRKLLKNKNAENAQASKIEPNWNVSGTWDFHPSRNKSAVGSEIRTPNPLSTICSTLVAESYSSGTWFRIPALALQFKVIQFSVFVFGSKVTPVNRSFPSFLYSSLTR